jgi:hypothetical protein
MTIQLAILFSFVMVALCFLFAESPRLFFWWIETGSKKFFAWRGKFGRRMGDSKTLDVKKMRGEI